MKSENHIIENIEKHLKPYEQFNANDGNFKHGFGNMMYKGKQENMYTSEIIIHDWITEPLLKSLDSKKREITIADFGGAAGATLKVVAKQIGLEKMDCYNIDINKEALERGSKDSQEIHFINSPLSKIPIKDNFFDAGYSRFALQYNPLISENNKVPTQAEILKEWHRVMNSQSALVIIWPAAKSKEEYTAFNEFAATIHSYMSGRSIEETLEQRSLTDADTIAEIAESIGFKVLSSELLEMDYLTVEKYYSRFGEKMKQHEATLEGLRKVQQEAVEKYSNVLKFVEIDGQQVLDTGPQRIVLKK